MLKSQIYSCILAAGHLISLAVQAIGDDLDANSMFLPDADSWLIVC